LLESDFSIGFAPGRRDDSVAASQKKADVAKHPKVLKHVGLLFNEPPGTAGLPFIKSSENEPPVSAQRPSYYCSILYRRGDVCRIPEE
jgi:hypothetical protein